jgi:flagella basal body P-ring formation protein FlgA
MLSRLTIIVALALASGIAAQGLTVAVHGEVYVAGRVVLLSEVAVLSGDAGLKATAERITCGRAPVEGSKAAVELTREYLLGRLMSAGIANQRIEMKGAEKVLVYGAAAWGREPGPRNGIVVDAPTVANSQPAGQPASQPNAAASPLPEAAALQGESVSGRQSLVAIAIDEIRASVATRLDCKDEEIEIIESTPNPHLLRLPTGQVRFLSVRNTGNRGAALGKQTWEINATVDGIPQTQLILTVTIARLVDTVVAMRPLMPATLITEADVRVERRPVTTMVVTTYSKTADVVGMEVRTRTINEGASIETSMVQPGTLIKRGDRVTVTGTSGRTKITFSGTATTPGVRGGTVRVEWTFAGENNRQERKVVDARVTGVGTAEVD